MLVESIGDSRGDREEGSCGGAIFDKTVLSGSLREGGSEEGKEEAFKEFRGWAEEGDRAV